MHALSLSHTRIITCICLTFEHVWRICLCLIEPYLVLKCLDRSLKEFNPDHTNGNIKNPTNARYILLPYRKPKIWRALPSETRTAGRTSGSTSLLAGTRRCRPENNATHNQEIKNSKVGWITGASETNDVTCHMASKWSRTVRQPRHNRLT